METAKEELQSVNEKLPTVNAELRILRYTPAATRIINLIQTDVGRPVSHIVSNLEGYDTFQQDIREVLDTLVPKETEVRTRAGA